MKVLVDVLVPVLNDKLPVVPVVPVLNDDPEPVVPVLNDVPEPLIELITEVIIEPVFDVCGLFDDWSLVNAPAVPPLFAFIVLIPLIEFVLLLDAKLLLIEDIPELAPPKLSNPVKMPPEFNVLINALGSITDMGVELKLGAGGETIFKSLNKS